MLSRKFVDTIPMSFRPGVRVHVKIEVQKNTRKNLDSGFRRNDEKEKVDFEMPRGDN
jgi:tRNA/tmRNA/rRNA uracil-C5-methylase (TrmA/RlmC/RlmD family)